MSVTARTRWRALVVLSSLYALYNVVKLAIGEGGWPQIVGLALAVAVTAYSVARFLGWEGIQR